MTRKEYVIKQVSRLPEFSRTGIVNIEEVVDVFFEMLHFKISDDRLNGVGEKIYSGIGSITKGVNYEGLLLAMSALNSVEIYAKKILFITNLTEFENITTNKQGCFPVLKALGFSNLQAGKISERRNKEGIHECAELGMVEIYALIDKFLLDYLQITNIKLAELKELISSKEQVAYFPSEYIRNIKTSYEENKQGQYLDVHWHGEIDDSIDCKIDDIINNKNIWGGNTFGVKFLGEAGTGKTTALKRLQYRLAKRYIDGKSDKIPVFVSLCELNQENGALMGCILEQTRLNKEELLSYMSNGQIVLLLDGYNEILDQMIQRNVAKEIDSYLRLYYHKMHIYISDRTITRNAIPVMTDSFKLFLKALSYDDKMYFLKSRMTKDDFRIIEEQGRNNVDFFNQFDTPLKLENLAKVVSVEKRIPDDIISSYINMLFDREKNENKEIGMDAIEDLLRALAIYIYIAKNETDMESETPMIGRIEAMMVLAEVKNKLGYSIEPEHFERVTKGMLLLEWENNCVGFSNREYLSHFMFEGIELGIENLIQVNYD